MRILLGMSGGIDSTIAAILLQRQGYEVVGCTFRTYDSIKESCLAREKGCCDVESLLEAKANCRKMGIEHHIVDFRDVFRREVIANFISEYQHGRTPNPCVLCNRHIKWGEMLRVADELGCERIATGHYARIACYDGRYYLRTAADTTKDQTYFLWMLTQEQLARTVFPLGDYTKEQVRQMAREAGLIRLAEKAESQDICFVPDGDYRRFLADEGVTSQTGRIIADGRVLAQHEGIHRFTIGQRKGLGVATGYPAFVTAIDAATGDVTLGHREELEQSQISLSDAFFLSDPTLPVQAKIRYRTSPAEAYIETREAVSLHFPVPVWAPTPGQSVVCYQPDTQAGDGSMLLVGGGFIS